MFQEMMIGSSGGGGYSGYTKVYQDTGAAKNHTISGQNGKKLLALVWNVYNSNVSPNRFDSTTATGGTLTKLSNITVANRFGTGTYFLLEPSSNTCVLSNTYDCEVTVYCAE